jgi:hypothetical protein
MFSGGPGVARSPAARLLFAFVLALLASALAPVTARASCGDWLVDHTGRSANDASPAAERDALPLAPCHGPECRRSQPTTPTAPPQHNRIQSERDAAIVASGVAIAERSLNPWTLSSDEPLVANHRSPLERPPRAVN